MDKLIEKDFNFSSGDSKLIEKIISDGNVDLNHMIFPKNEGLPVHNANSNVYMIVIRGQLTLQLDDQEPHKYARGKIINIPYSTKMDVGNNDDEVLEIFVVKAPSPFNYNK
ncbi:MAG: cupin domain-containing protein [Eubacteriales bacterium]